MVGRRISVCLDELYDDERRLFYIILNNRFQVIYDLEEYIKNTFSVEGISLICNGHLLPSCEEIEILDGYDSIGVIRSPFQEKLTSKKRDKNTKLDTTDPNCETFEEKPKSKKKKRYENCDDIDEEPKKSKKKKDSKKEKINGTLEEEPVLPKKKKKKCHISESEPTPEVVPEINSIEKTITDTPKSEVEIAEFDEIPMEIQSPETEPPKTETEVNNNAEKTNGFHNPNREIQILNIETITPMEVETTRATPNKIKKKTDFLAIGEFLNYAKYVNTKFSSSTTVNPDTPVLFTAGENEVKNTSESEMPVPSSVFVTKRRRRLRHRKSNSKTDECSSVTSQSDFETREPLRTIASPSLHIRFNETEQNNIVTKLEEIRKLDLSKSIDDVKYSILGKDVFPKVDDVIAFKLLELNDNYEPGLSDWIIGRVLSWCDTSKDIELVVVAGRLQVALPRGKFGLTENTSGYNEPALFKGVGAISFLNYPACIEPRLLILE